MSLRSWLFGTPRTVTPPAPVAPSPTPEEEIERLASEERIREAQNAARRLAAASAAVSTKRRLGEAIRMEEMAAATGQEDAFRELGEAEAEEATLRVRVRAQEARQRVRSMQDRLNASGTGATATTP